MIACRYPGEHFPGIAPNDTPRTVVCLCCYGPVFTREERNAWLWPTRHLEESA